MHRPNRNATVLSPGIPQPVELIFYGPYAPRRHRSSGRRHVRRKAGLSLPPHTARPDKDFIAWYEPTLGGSGAEPDFILYGNALGLLVLEVKDWEIDQIGEVTPHTFKFWTGAKEETRTNPDRQAKGYVNELMDLLKSHPEFHQGGGAHGGRLKIPLGRMVVFPQITRKDYLERGLDRLISLDRVLLAEDLEPAGEIGVDSTGEKFRARIAPAFLSPLTAFQERKSRS